MVRVLRGKVKDFRGKGSPEVDIQRLFFSFTMDSINKIFFGRDTNTTSGEDDTYSHAYDGAHHNMIKMIFGNLSMFVAHALPWPFGTWGKWRGLIKTVASLHGPGRAFYSHIDTLTRESLKIIDERRKNTRNGETKSDLLSLFLNSSDKFGVPFSHAKHRIQMRDIILNFVIA